jgi:hypothetical protein
MSRMLLGRYTRSNEHHKIIFNSYKNKHYQKKHKWLWTSYDLPAFQDKFIHIKIPSSDSETRFEFWVSHYMTATCQYIMCRLRCPRHDVYCTCHYEWITKQRQLRQPRQKQGADNCVPYPAVANSNGGELSLHYWFCDWTSYLIRDQGGRSVNLRKHLHSIRRLRTCGSVSSLPHTSLRRGDLTQGTLSFLN